ncbi:MAG: hypothetical protein B7Z21_00075 [Verrucomicrobiales bacterium 32-60-5]|nr:MAG: hypothetical protein B7Z21_00075 [Verrucomicrobiales bacterium 32-60-5]
MPVVVTFENPAKLVLKTHRSGTPIFNMDGDMVERKNLFPRPFRALPEAAMRGGACDPGLAASRLRPGLSCILQGVRHWLLLSGVLWCA